MNNRMRSLSFAEATVGFVFSCLSPVPLSNAMLRRTGRLPLKTHDFDLYRSKPFAGENRRGEGFSRGGWPRPGIRQCYLIEKILAAGCDGHIWKSMNL